MPLCFRHILLLCILLPGFAQAKRYTVKEIIRYSNNVLSEAAGEALFPYFKLDSGSFYEFKKGKNPKYKTLTKKKKCRKHLESITLKYNFLLPYFDCPWYDTVKGSITIELIVDTMLHVEKGPELGFIPPMVHKNETCHFISRDSAIKIALSNQLKSGVAPPYAFVKFRIAEQQFVWIVLRTIWNDRDYNNDKNTWDDMLVLEAETGRILEHRAIPYAPHID